MAATDRLSLAASPNLVARGSRYALVALLSAYFALSYATLPLFLNLKLYAQGLERTPYQYRLLTMFFFRAFAGNAFVLRAVSATPFLSHDPYRLILVGIAFVSILTAIAATRASIAILTGNTRYAFWASLLVVYMAQFNLAYAFDNPFTTPYDVPSLMFFSLGVYSILSRRWALYHLVYLLAIVNRETACFLPVFFAIWEFFRLGDQGTPTRKIVRWIAPQVAVQAVVWIALKLYLQHRFAANVEPGMHAGGLYTTHFVYNLKELLKPQQWPLLLSICGFALPLVFVQRRYLAPRGLKFAIAILLPLWFAGLLVVGVIIEIRIFADWIALIAPAVAVIVYNRVTLKRLA